MPRFAIPARGAVVALALVLALLTPPVLAAPEATLRAQLRPNRLGAGTSVSIGFRISPGADGNRPPLSEFSLRLPSRMGFAASALGLATCSPATLLLRGADGCPHESLMGYGSARVRVPFGTGVVSEAAHVSIFMARPVEQHTTTL